MSLKLFRRDVSAKATSLNFIPEPQNYLDKNDDEELCRDDQNLNLESQNEVESSEEDAPKSQNHVESARKKDVPEELRVDDQSRELQEGLCSEKDGDSTKRSCVKEDQCQKPHQVTEEDDIEGEDIGEDDYTDESCDEDPSEDCQSDIESVERGDDTDMLIDEESQDGAVNLIVDSRTESSDSYKEIIVPDVQHDLVPKGECDTESMDKTELSPEISSGLKLETVLQEEKSCPEWGLVDEYCPPSVTPSALSLSSQGQSGMMNGSNGEQIFFGEGVLQVNLSSEVPQKPSVSRRYMKVHKKNFSCSVCFKSFSRASHLNRHFLVHTGEKTFFCSLCQKSFYQIDSLRNHLKCHTKEKVFECKFCSKKFFFDSKLKQHLMVHTGEKPFGCDICPKAFSQPNYLRRHMTVHTGEKPFTCEVCYQTFSRDSNMRQHMVIHTGDKPFTCPNCQKCFSRANSLKYHKSVCKVTSLHYMPTS